MNSENVYLHAVRYWNDSRRKGPLAREGGKGAVTKSLIFWEADNFMAKWLSVSREKSY